VKRSYQDASQVACESVSAMRIVTSLNLQRHFSAEYISRLQVPFKLGMKKAYLSSIAYGLSQALIFFAYSLAFWYGSRLILNGSYDYLQMNRVMYAIIFTAMAAGQVTSFAPNVAKAKEGAAAIYSIIDRQCRLKEGTKPVDSAQVAGTVQLENVQFRYPTRADVPILDKISLLVKEGQSVALVGPSGCGKSTVIGLIERFYDVDGGRVLFDGLDVKTLVSEDLRRSLAVVSQEPALFNRTVAENILYGSPDASMASLVESAKMANIHDFIEGLPDKYETVCGSRGSQLSGGQKQRIAIARAVKRSECS
jgi:ABC-type multidrug transport system fused ATPase/permease subunit